MNGASVRGFHFPVVRRLVHMNRASKDIVEAEVILRPATEHKSSRGSESKAKTVRQSEALPETVDYVSSKLRALGFDVLATTPLTISIAGSKELFKRVFHAAFVGEDESSASLKTPDDLEIHVEGIYIQVPPTYFKH
jgi:hypothetical protein